MPKRITEGDILSELASMEVPDAKKGEYSLSQVCEKFGWSRDRTKTKLENLVKSGKATARRAMVETGKKRVELRVYRLSPTTTSKA